MRRATLRLRGVRSDDGDNWDLDSVQQLMLLNLTINRRTRKVIPPAAKNGFFYVLDRVTGELISAEPFVKVSWALGIGKHGRPVVNPGREMTCSRPSGKSQTTRLSDSARSETGTTTAKSGGRIAGKRAR